MQSVILCPLKESWFDLHTLINEIEDYHISILVREPSYDTYIKKIESRDGIRIIAISSWDYSNLEMAVYNLNKQEKIKNLTALIEEDINLAARLREKFAIPGQSIKSALFFRDKKVMKDHIRKFGFHIPAYTPVHCINDLKVFIRKYRYPVIIKPRDGAGSIGCHIIDDEDDLKEVEDSYELLKDCLVEKFITGKTYHVDGLVLNNQLIYSFAGWYFNDSISFQQGKSYASIELRLKDPLQLEINRYCKRLVSAMSFIAPSRYIFHLELFIKNGNIIFNEIGCRLGGARILQGIKHRFDFNPVHEYLRFTITGNTPLLNQPHFNYEKDCGWLMSTPKVGKLIKLPNKPIIPGMFDYRLFGKLGYQYNGGSSSIDCISACSIEGNTSEEVMQKLKEFDEYIKKSTKYKLDN